MTPNEFVRRYLPYAQETERKKGISAVFTLAQAALESGWGESVYGNMFFGVKDTDGLNGNEQLLVTREVHNSPNVKYPVILKITQTGKRLWTYKVKDWFRKYNSPEESFTDHADFFHKNKRYREALKVAHDPIAFASAIAKAGYATDPNYATSLIGVIRTVQRNLPKQL